MSRTLTSLERCGPRRLRMERLEPRELLSVNLVPGSEHFKSFDFAVTGSKVLHGTWTFPGYERYPGTFSSTSATVTGHAAYTSATAGAITVNSASGVGKWTTLKSGFNGTFSLTNGKVVNGQDQNGQFTGTASGDLRIGYNPHPDTDYDNTSFGPGSATGTFNGPAEKMKMQYKDGPLNLYVEGTIVPNPAPSTFAIQINSQDVSLTPATDGVSGPTLDVKVNVAGGVHKATSYTAKGIVGTNVKIYWATGTAFTNRVGSPLRDKIPIDWNEASGEYQIPNLPLPPSSKTPLRNLLFVAEDTNTLVGTYELPSTFTTRPTLSIADGQVIQTGGTYLARFAVNLSSASMYVTKFSYSTQNGSGATGAKSNGDYQKTTGNLTFAPGNTATQYIDVPLHPSAATVAKPNYGKVFSVKLKLNTPSWTLSGDLTGQGTIPSPMSSLNAAFAQGSAEETGLFAAGFLTAASNRKTDSSALLAATDAALAESWA